MRGEGLEGWDCRGFGGRAGGRGGAEGLGWPGRRSCASMHNKKYS